MGLDKLPIFSDIQIQQSSDNAFHLPIPNTDNCEHPTMVLTNPLHPTFHCYCPTVQTSAYSFSACVEHCTGNNNTLLVDNSVVFHTATDGMPVHFICNLDLCIQPRCNLKIVLTTHRLIFTTGELCYS